MSNVAKLKKQAAEFEAKKQFDKALAIYVKMLQNYDEYPDEIDVAMFNRVGDLHLRLGNVGDAVDYYEKAVDKYADAGLFNNAIALCNKILRQSPGRASIYYKLGKISALKGFKADAKQNFLEYAERMQKAGNMEEAFRALTEFADLCPDQDDIRLMLADQLTKAGKKDDAVEQLQMLHERYTSEGRDAEASATAERLRVLDPSIEARAGSAMVATSSNDLVFLDLDDTPKTPRRSSVQIPAAKIAPAPAALSAPPPPPAPPAAPARTSADDVIEVTRVNDIAASIDVTATPAGGMLGLESTNLAENIEPAPTMSLDFETTSLTPDEPIAAAPPPAPPAVRTPAAPVKAIEIPDVVEENEPEILDLDSMDLGTPSSSPVAQRPSSPTPAHTPAVESEGDDIELLDLDIPEAPEPEPVAARVSRSSRALTPSFSLLDEPEPDPTATPDDGAMEIPGTPPRSSTLFAAQSVEILSAAVEGEPNDWSLRRELAEAMLEAGDRAGGLSHLAAAMQGAEDANDLALAASLADELVRLEPDDVKHHQKRVELAFRRNDKTKLVEAYIALADVLVRSDQAEKARTVYERVLNLDPNEMRAKSAIENLPAPEPEPAPEPPRGSKRMSTMRTPPSTAEVAAPAANDFVNLGDWLRDEEEPKDTRMVVAEKEPTGDEDADFADMLAKFKQGVAANVDAEDYQSHYDLAIAYKEMGLIDEAISGFQRALAGPKNRVATFEALGQCFLEKEQPRVASSILQRALNEPNASDETLVGVLYLLGRAAEVQNKPAEAAEFYSRVFVVDIQFKDVADRLNEVERAAR